ncbi:MAG: hypothetical protein RJA40_937 [Actinomycetota bacterium]
MTTLTSPHDLLAAIPFLIGYHPEDSLVVVSIKDNAVGMAMRIDYPVDIPQGAYDLLASHLQRDFATGALLVAYVPKDRSDGEDVLRDASAALTRIGIATDESLLIQGGRYRSILCQDQSCCPIDGSPIPEISGSRIAVEHVVAGRAMPFANLQVDKDANDLSRLQRDGATAIIDLAGEFASGRIGQDLELTARVIGRLSDIQVRDFALGTHDQESIDTYFQMWRHLMRIAPSGYVAPIASLCAALAYESGDGALAHRALDRALEDVNGYSLALLLRRVFTAGWPPASFAAMRRELHPKVCAGIFGETLPPGFGL